MQPSSSTSVNYIYNRHMPQTDFEVGSFQRIGSASVGALLTSLFVTPFDVIKTRLQVQAPVNKNHVHNCEHGGKPHDNLSNYNIFNEKPYNNYKMYYRNYTNCYDIAPVRPTCSLSCSSSASFSSAVSSLHSSSLAFPPLSSAPTSYSKNISFNNAIDAFIKIVRHEGVNHLYTGLNVTIWMALPATILYYSTYDILRNAMLNHIHHHKKNNPFSLYNDLYIADAVPAISGMLGRVFAVSVISPLELLRTQMMARTINRDLTIVEAMRQNINAEGFKSLWKGLIPTLWRDVPFSGLYWTFYELYKDYLINHRYFDINATFGVSFCSGVLSGMQATLLTQPFDVVKTRRQAILLGIHKDNTNSDTSKSINIYNNNKSTPYHNHNHDRYSLQYESHLSSQQMSSIRHAKLFEMLKDIYRNEGFKGLYIGIGARMARVPLACAIMVSTYEVGKHILSSQWVY